MKRFTIKTLLLAVLMAVGVTQTLWAQTPMTWAWVGTKTGNCNPSDNASISYNTLNNTLAGSSSANVYDPTNDGNGYITIQQNSDVTIPNGVKNSGAWPTGISNTFGHHLTALSTSSVGQRHTLMHSIYSSTANVPSYCKLTRSVNATLYVLNPTSGSAQNLSTTVYFFNTLALAQSTAVYFRNNSGDVTNYSCHSDGGTSDTYQSVSSTSPRSCEYDNSRGSEAADASIYAILGSSAYQFYTSTRATYYASFTSSYVPANDVYTYYRYVTYDANGGSGSMDESTFAATDGTGTLAANAFTRSGYAFLGWSTDPNATTAEYANQGSIPVNSTHKGPVTLYAVWESGYVNAQPTVSNNYTFDVNPKGHTVTYQWYSKPTSTGTATVISGATSNKLDQTNADIYNYCVATFYTGTTVDFTIQSDDAVLPHYTVTLGNYSNGTVAGLNEEGIYLPNATATLTATPGNKAEFKGWKKNAASATYISTDATYSFVVNSNVTLYPVFERIHDFTTDVIYGDLDGTSSSSSYDWVESTKGGIAYQSNNCNVSSSTSSSTITITPKAGVSAYNLSFNYWVYSEGYYDALKVVVTNNGTSKTLTSGSSRYGDDYISGTSVAVQSYSGQALTGETTITVIYTKDGSGSYSPDCGYIYNIAATAVAMAIASPEGTTIEPENWDAYLEEHPNAVGYVDDENSSIDKENVFVKQEGTDAEGKAIYKTNHLTVTDGTDFEMPEAIKDANNTAVLAEYTRNQSGYSWGTLCLPFDIQAGDGGYDYYNFAGVSGSTMSFTKIADGTTIAAGTPVIVKKTGEATVSGENVPVVSTTSSASGTWTLHGTLTAIDRMPEGYFFNSDKFWYTDYAKYPADVKIPAYRCYFTTTTSGNAKASVFDLMAIEGDSTTQIGTIDAEGKATFFENGKYMENGQIVIVKNGKKYNAAGQRME